MPSYRKVGLRETAEQKESQAHMGTVMLHFRRPKIALFFCDSNISHIWGREDHRQNKDAQNIL